MSDLLVYVNESITCSVVMENFKVTLEAFRRDTLDEQVGDVLPPQYKFTRLLKNQRVVIGVKQEAALKLAQCVQKEEDNFAVHLLGEETSNLKGNEPAESRDGDQGDQDQVQQVPPRKKAKISRQPTLFDLCAPRTSTQQPTPSPFSTARARKVKIFSEQEIDESIGMQKSYRQFWNDKAEELCSSNALKDFKPGEIQGAINVAWSLKKTEILKEELEEINMEIATRCTGSALKKMQMSKSTVEKNTTRVDAAVSTVKEAQKKLTTERQKYLESTNKSERKLAAATADEIENNSDFQMVELQRAQDALRKALNARKKLLQLEDESQPADSDSSGF